MTEKPEADPTSLMHFVLALPDLKPKLANAMATNSPFDRLFDVVMFDAWPRYLAATDYGFVLSHEATVAAAHLLEEALK